MAFENRNGGQGTSRFIRACLRQPVDRTPVWFLRQAGRYMPEYMAVRKHHTLLEICRTPDIAAEVTITAAERLGVDAAIIFADLLLPFTPMGLDFEFVNGEGPVVHNPVRTLAHVEALQTDRADELGYVAQAIAKVAKHFNTRVPSRIPSSDPGAPFFPATPDRAGSPGADNPQRMDQLGIIGFIGAPFTLASYMIEGGSSRNYIETKKLMYASAPASTASSSSSPTLSSRSEAEGPAFPPTDPSFRPERTPVRGVEKPLYSPASAPGASPKSANPDSKAWPLLLEKLLAVLTAYAQQQIDAGADVIQIFDSWAGALSVADYRAYVLAPTTELVARVRAMGVPVIYFGVDTASLLPTMRETGADVLGLDWRIPLDEGWRAAGPGCAIQGNLDPITLFAPAEVIETRVREILTLANHRPGHIFNLGHGIVPNTPVEAVLQVTDLVKRYGLHPTKIQRKVVL